MVQVRVEHKPGFSVMGRRTWIGGDGPSNEPFGRFWDDCRANGYLEALNRATGGLPGVVTGGVILGVSLIVDPAVRNFFYCIGAEGVTLERCEGFCVPAGEWAIFYNRGVMPDALVEAEMLAFGQWLPKSGRRHSVAPELEVYLPSIDKGVVSVEFWLPLEAVAESAGADVGAHDRADVGGFDLQTGKAF